MIITVVGMCGAGKSTVCEYLIQKGIPRVYFGQVTMDWLKEQGMEITPANEKKAQVEIRKQYGMGAFARLLLPHIDARLQENQDISIDGLYSTEEYEVLLDTFSNPTDNTGKTGKKNPSSKEIVVVEVYSDKSLRYKRLQERKVRPFALQECIERDWNEVKLLNKGGPIALSDYKIPNLEDKKTLHSEVEVFLDKVRANQQ